MDFAFAVIRILPAGTDCFAFSVASAASHFLRSRERLLVFIVDGALEICLPSKLIILPLQTTQKFEKNDQADDTNARSGEHASRGNVP